MLHPIWSRWQCLTDGERATLLAVAQATIPPGRIFKGAGPGDVAKVEAFLAQRGSALLHGYRVLIRAIDAAAWTTHLLPFHRLDPQGRERLLESWRTADVARRTMLRALLTPLKVAHFDDPEIFRAVGCTYVSEGAKNADLPRGVTEHVMSAAALDRDEEMECDVVVIGTGAGGAVVARELAERGHAVLVLEEGEYVTRTDFTTRAVEMQQRLYRDMGATLALGNSAIPVPVGRAVGGSTTINSGTCYRLPDRVLRKWQTELGLKELTADALAPYYERVEQVLQVGPTSRRFLGAVADIIARGCERLGYTHHQPLLRNAPDCDGQGVCCFGCPTDAKRSTNVSYVPLALRAGAQLVTSAQVVRVLAEGTRAVGVLARATSGGRRALKVRARMTVVACGALYTPALLERSGLCQSSGQLGRNLSIHPAAAAFAGFDENLDSWSSVPQGYAIEEFRHEGILFEGGTPPLELSAGMVSLVGRRFVDLVEQFQKVAVFGFLIEDRSRGRVRATKSGRPLITYFLEDHDVARIKRGHEILARVFLAAGARWVNPMIHGFDAICGEKDLSRLRNARLTARDFDLSAYHPLGTARMGMSPEGSVVGPDHATHDVEGLYIADGSTIPSPLGVNPQLTIMALASRAAELMDRELSG